MFISSTISRIFLFPLYESVSPAVSTAMTNSSATMASLTKVTFSWYDYILFVAMLLLSALIGVYFGFCGKKQTTTKDYLMGGKTMKVIPIAISLVASHTSGITLLALPADVYSYGAAYWLGCFSMIFLAFVTVYVYLPVFFNLQITSTYEYLERRFDNRTRVFASFLYGLSVLLYLPIVVYIPALAFSAATGVSVHLISPIVCGICIFYTTVGGLKAVVWTDTIQFTVTVGAVITVVILGCNGGGGLGAVWNKAWEGGRLDIFDFDPDPTKRESFWIIIIGLTVHWMGHTSVNQSCVQKFLAVPTLQKASRSVFYYCFGMSVIKTASVLTGFVMYAKYSNCDPFSTKQVTKNDQLLPYYVMDVARNIPGLSGLFVAGVFSAALSTLSATLNCLAGTIYEDFISKLLGKSVTDRTANYALKLIVVIAGVACTALVLVIEHLGSILALAIALTAVTNGPLLGMFTLGLLFPKANAKGGFFGGIAGLVVLSGIAFPAKYYQSQGFIKYEPKPLYTDQCDYVNETVSLIVANVTPAYDDISSTVASALNATKEQFQPNFLFRISFYYYTLIGAAISMIVGLIVSYLTNENDPPVDKSLISPVCHFLLPEKSKICDEAEYRTVEGALHTLTNTPENGP